MKTIGNQHLNQQKAFNKIKETISNYKAEPTKKAVIILGDSGEGKSTLINLLANNPLIVQKNYFRKLYFKEQNKVLKGIQIGEGGLSKTSVPGKWVDEKQDITYWDCPGFNDTKGFKQDIINGFYIKKIFDSSEEIKSVIVISQNTIQGRANIFLGILRKLKKLFVNIQQIKESLSLVLTKSSMKNPENFKDFLLNNFLPEQEQFIDARQKQLLEYFASKKNNVFIFSAPQKEGELKISDNKILKNVISSTKYIKNPQIKITVDPNSLVVLNKFEQDINKNIIEQSKIMNKELQNYVNDIIRKEETFEMVQKQLNELKKYVQQIQKSKLPKEFLFNYENLIIKYKFNKNLAKKLSDDIQLLNFIRLVKPKMQETISFWKQNICVEKLIDKLLSVPETKFTQNNSVLNIISLLIRAHDIQKIIKEKKSQETKFVNIFIYDTIFIDSDIVNPGINMSILAKNWKIVGKRQISLKGVNAKDYNEPASSFQCQGYQGQGLNGQNGKPGKPGQTGGSFFGKIMEEGNITGGRNLSIDVRGGNGGKGQNGGNGGNGGNGQDGSEKDVYNRDKNCLVCRQQYDWSKKDNLEKFNKVWKTLGTFNGQMLETYRSVGTNGKCGGNGGSAGAGGKGGFSGFVKLDGILSYKDGIIAKIDKGHGKEGKQGEMGRGGIGGKNGDTVEGKYIEQSLFTKLREKGKIIEDKGEKGKSNEDTIIGSQLTSLTTAGMVTADQLALQSTGKAFLSGVCSLGISLAVQTGLSVISAQISSNWKEEPHIIQNGRADSGLDSRSINSTGQQNPLLPFQINDSYVQQLESCYNKYSNKNMNLFDNKVNKLNFF